MRRKEREITEYDDIIAVLNDCPTLRIAMQDTPCPYLIPVSFGFVSSGGKLTVYFHCARQGTKLERIAADPHIAFEGDIFLGYEQTAHGVTARYRSVAGTGRCSIVTDESEILLGLKCLLDHCGMSDYTIGNCGGLQHLYVCRIEVDSLTGKQNLPGT